MKKALLFCSIIAVTMIAYAFQTGTSSGGDYVIIGWNDLGMHCMNQDFSNLAILPPYNNVMAQVIKRGTASSNPKVVTDIGYVTYEVPGNTTSSDKTNFWTYARKLFGADLPKDVGLTGNKLSGKMKAAGDYFIADGIPMTPFTDANPKTEDPYQLILLKAYDKNGAFLAQTQTVIPVSTEMKCVNAGCHSSEIEILSEHPREEGFNPRNKPFLCASCHASNALGTKGIKEAKPLSFRIHDEHAEKAKSCYNCHPGEKTQCFRDVMKLSGMKCENCHGSMKNIAKTIEKGRQPWLQEPSCGATACHGSNYAEEKGKLFRQSKGHGGVFCSGCHGSPHAIVPTAEYARDNVQNTALQGYEGILKLCTVCHYSTPTDPGPHNIILQKISILNDNVPDGADFKLAAYPNPARDQIKLKFTLVKEGNVHLEIYNEEGSLVATVVNQYLLPAEYEMPLDLSSISSGSYNYILRVDGERIISKIFKVVK